MVLEKEKKRNGTRNSWPATESHMLNYQLSRRCFATISPSNTAAARWRLALSHREFSWTFEIDYAERLNSKRWTKVAFVSSKLFVERKEGWITLSWVLFLSCTKKYHFLYSRPNLKFSIIGTKKSKPPENIDHLFFYYSQVGVLRVCSLNGFRLDVSGNRSIYEVAHPQFFLHAFADNCFFFSNRQLEDSIFAPCLVNVWFLWTFGKETQNQ